MVAASASLWSMMIFSSLLRIAISPVDILPGLERVQTAMKTACMVPPRFSFGASILMNSSVNTGMVLLPINEVKTNKLIRCEGPCQHHPSSAADARY